MKTLEAPDIKNELLKYTDISDLNVSTLKTKNFELFEILNKLTFYSKKPAKSYLKYFYNIAILFIGFIAKKELSKF